MTTEETDRRSLYDRLEEVLGVREAHTLMTYLPSATELATRADVDELKTEVRGLRGRFDGLEERMDIRMGAIERDMDRFHDHLQGFRWDMADFNTHLNGFHQSLREQARNFALSTVGAVLTTAVIAFGAAALI